MTHGGLQAIDRRILGFVSEPVNGALAPLTRSFSTPFRGTLFGHAAVAEIESELARRPAGALVLGTNPNVSNLGDVRFGSLQDHITSGRFGESYRDAGGAARPGWQPLDEWRWRSQPYEILRMAGIPLDTVAYSNYLPWGSAGNVKRFAASLDASLLRRAVDFADELLALTLELLRPRMVIAMCSISSELPSSGISALRAKSRHGSFEYRTAGGARRTFNYFIGSRDGRTRVMHVPHPSSWRFGDATRHEVVSLLADEVRNALAS